MNTKNKNRIFKKKIFYMGNLWVNKIILIKFIICLDFLKLDVLNFKKVNRIWKNFALDYDFF